MRWDAGVPRGPGEALAVPSLDVGPVFLDVLLGQSQVYDVHAISLIARGAYAHQEIVGLDVPVKKPHCVDETDAEDHLFGEHQHSLQW